MKNISFIICIALNSVYAADKPETPPSSYTIQFGDGSLATYDRDLLENIQFLKFHFDINPVTSNKYQFSDFPSDKSNITEKRFKKLLRLAQLPATSSLDTPLDEGILLFRGANYLGIPKLLHRLARRIKELISTSEFFSEIPEEYLNSLEIPHDIKDALSHELTESFPISYLSPSTLALRDNATTQVTFSDDGEFLLFFSKNEIRKFDLSTRGLIDKQDTWQGKAPDAVCPNGSYFIINNLNLQPARVNLPTAHLYYPFRNRSQICSAHNSCVSLSPIFKKFNSAGIELLPPKKIEFTTASNKYFFIQYDNGCAHLVQNNPVQNMGYFSPDTYPEEQTLAACLSVDSRLFALTHPIFKDRGGDIELFKFDPLPPEKIAPIKTPDTTHVTEISFSVSGKYLLWKNRFPDNKNQFIIWDFQNKQLLRKIDTDNASHIVTSLSDDNIFAINSGDNTITINKIDDARFLMTLAGSAAQNMPQRLCIHGNLLANNFGNIWDISNKQIFLPLEINLGLSALLYGGKTQEQKEALKKYITSQHMAPTIRTYVDKVINPITPPR